MGKKNKDKDDDGVSLKAIIYTILGVIVIGFFLTGPKACTRDIAAWTARAYGANWAVVQYNQSGGVIACWKLNNASVASERHSDGVYFKTNEGNIVHLSGHYVYTQMFEKGEKLEKKYKEVKKRYKVNIKCHGE